MNPVGAADPESRALFGTGSCLCGRSGYALRALPLYAGYCHCTQCRKFSGAACSAFLGLKAVDFEIVRGDPAQLGCHWKTATTRMRFCQDCGSSLFVEKLQEGLVHVRMGTLDGASPVQPMAHVFVGSKADWFEITDGLPQFEASIPYELARQIAAEAADRLGQTVASADADLIGRVSDLGRSALVETPVQAFHDCLGRLALSARTSMDDGIKVTDFYTQEPTPRVVASVVEDLGRAPRFLILRELVGATP